LFGIATPHRILRAMFSDKYLKKWCLLPIRRFGARVQHACKKGWFAQGVCRCTEQVKINTAKLPATHDGNAVLVRIAYRMRETARLRMNIRQ
jgi:hypothetical protein